jgi:predicted enzyme related to lactoylglutathione lyase
MSENAKKFVWYDLLTGDTKAAESFYAKVIWWDAQDSGVPDRPYTLLSAGPVMVAGIMPTPAEGPAAGKRPVWTGYVGVDDVDAYADRIKAAGGSICRPPEDIPHVGRFAIVSDPHGAVFALFSAASEPPPVPEPGATPGRIGWHELYCGDLDSDFAFYSDLFGWTKADAMDMGPMGIYQLFATGGAPNGGMMNRPPQIPAPFWLFYFNVNAVDAAVERVKEGGGQIISGPMQVPGGSWIVQAADPQGAMFAFVAPQR